MCVRYELDPEERELERLYRYRVKHGLKVHPNYNVAPTHMMPIVTFDGDLVLQPMKWGIHRNIGPKIEKDIFNTRADKAFSPFWAKTLRNGRCLIPATGFYEWQATGGDKQPYYIRPKDRHLFMFAGIYSLDNEGVYTYSMMTTEPNKEMSEVHNRMPVILHPEDELNWLNSDTDEKMSALLIPLEDGALDMRKISNEVNFVKNNYPGLTKAV